MIPALELTLVVASLVLTLGVAIFLLNGNPRIGRRHGKGGVARGDAGAAREGGHAQKPHPERISRNG